MNRSASYIIIILILIIFSSFNKPIIETDQRINAIIGDISFIEKFGTEPTRETNENLRIKTHLAYVENLLRKKDVSTLTKEQSKNRQKMLRLLNEYRNAAVFPKNVDFIDKRMPCFIDQDGRICAVGYLIEQTAGRKVAEEINDKYKYENLLAMRGGTIENWIESSGLTKEECAMIQPTYDYNPQPTRDRESCIQLYEGASSVISVLNLSLSTINAIQIAKGANSKFAPAMGIITGAGQIAFGTVGNDQQRNYSKLNFGVGAGTMILSAWNLLTHKKPKEKSLVWNIYNAPVGNQDVIGLAFTKKF